MKQYTKEQLAIQLKAHPAGENWFYVCGGICSFHNAKHHGEGVYVNWRTLKSVLKKAGLI